MRGQFRHPPAFTRTEKGERRHAATEARPFSRRPRGGGNAHPRRVRLGARAVALRTRRTAFAGTAPGRILRRPAAEIDLSLPCRLRQRSADVRRRCGCERADCISSACATEIGAAQSACTADRVSQNCFNSVSALRTCAATCLGTPYCAGPLPRDLTSCREALRLNTPTPESEPTPPSAVACWRPGRDGRDRSGGDQPIPPTAAAPWGSCCSTGGPPEGEVYDDREDRRADAVIAGDADAGPANQIAGQRPAAAMVSAAACWGGRAAAAGVVAAPGRPSGGVAN